MKTREFTTDIECEKQVVYTISKDMKIVVNDVPAFGYRSEDDLDELEYEEHDLSQREWTDLFEQQHYTITGLMDILIHFAKERQKECEPKSAEWKKMQGIIEDSELWRVDEMYIDEI